MASALERRIKVLEKQNLQSAYPPMPLSYFYGEPLPADFYTRPRQDGPRTLAEFYESADHDR